MHRHDVRLAARGEILCVLGVHLVEHLRREIGRRLPRREPLGDVGNAIVRAEEVMRRGGDRPLLRLGDFLEIRVTQPLDVGPGLLGLRLELFRERLAFGSHVGLLCRVAFYATFTAGSNASSSRSCRSSIAHSSPAAHECGARFAHSIASALDFTLMSQKPPMASFVSANGPSVTMPLPPEMRMRVLSVVGCSAATSTSTPASLSSSLYFITAATTSASGSWPASESWLAFTNIRNLILRSPFPLGSRRHPTPHGAHLDRSHARQRGQPLDLEHRG